MRSLAGALIVLFALFIVDNYAVRILLAAVAAVLAGTAFLRYCPINTLLKRDSREEPTHEDSVEPVSEDTTEPAPEEHIEDKETSND